VYVQPGQVVASKEECVFSTILGSCVAVCLWDPVTLVGGLNHFLLPRAPPQEQHSARFGNVAIPVLIDALLAQGASAARLQAKVFGGMCSLALKGTRTDLGGANVRIARELLGERRIPVVAEDVGGTRGRRLLFRTGDGSVWVKQL
jgi:chemotaxis protein CheD